VADDRYLSFEDTMKALNVGEDDLLNLVAANELRAFRIDREMKFKESDVKSMATARGGGQADIVDIEDADVVMVDAPGEVKIDAVPILEDAPAVDEALPEEPEVVLLDEDVGGAAATEEIALEDEAGGTVLLEDEDIELDTVGAAEEGQTEMASATELAPAADQTEAVLDAPTRRDGLGTEEIVFEDEDLAIGSLDDEASGTQEVTVQEGAIADEDVTIAEEDMEVTVAEDTERGTGVGASRRAAGISARASSRMSARRREVAVARAKGNPIMAGLLVLTGIMMLYPFGLYVATAYMGYTTQPYVNTSGSITAEMVDRGYVPELGTVFIPEQFRWTRNSLAPIPITDDRDPHKAYLEGGAFVYNQAPDEWWGRPRGFNPNARPDEQNPAPPAATPPTGGGEAPAGGGEAPAGGGEAPAGGGEAPAGGGEAPAGGGEAPAGGGQAPAGGGEAPAAN